MATTTQTNSAVGRAARPLDWSRWRYRLLAAGLLALGLALLATELNLLPADWARATEVGGPAALMLAGAGLARWGWPAGRRPMPAFAVERGEATCGRLVAVMGGHDLRLRAFAGSSQLAVGEFPNPRGPQVDAQARGTTTLTLEPRRAHGHLAGGPWSVAAAKAVPWALDVRAGGGHLDLDLRDLTVTSLQANSAFGNVALTLPAQGPAELNVSLGLGDLLVTVPMGVEAKLKLEVGPLVGVSVDERRFINVAPSEWMTPLYPTTAQRCTVRVEMAAGDLVVA